MSLLIVCFILAVVTRAVFIDMVYAIRGRTPPRVKERIIKFQAAAATGQAVAPPLGIWDVLGGYLRMVWESSRDERIAKQRTKRAARRGPARTFLGRRWEEAWQALEDKVQARRANKQARRAKKKAGGETPPSQTAAPPAPPSPTGQAPDSAPGSPGGAPPSTNVIPFRRKDEEMTDLDMSGTDLDMSGHGEVTGLATAQIFAARMASGLSAQVAATEQFLASLSAAGVSGEAVEGATRAAELLSAAAAAWQSVNAELQSHGQVAEAYRAAPGAGSREFNTSE